MVLGRHLPFGHLDPHGESMWALKRTSSHLSNELLSVLVVYPKDMGPTRGLDWTVLEVLH